MTVTFHVLANTPVTDILSFKLLLYIIYVVRSEVLTAVVIRNSICWDVTPCSPLKVNQRFGGTNPLHLQG
jgi:hypothetical protein